MEEAESIISLARICRACLNERTQMKPLFDARLAEMMMACANIVVSIVKSFVIEYSLSFP